MFRFFRWLFGIKDEEESTENNNRNDVQKEQHNEIFKLKTEVIKLKKEARASRERNEKSEQTMRNLNSRLEMLEDDNTDGSSEPDPDVLDIDINPYEKERRKREKDKPSNER